MQAHRAVWEVQTREMNQTGKCQKCASEISTEAERCPECGHEPSALGITDWILIFLSINGLGFSFLMLSVFLLFWRFELTIMLLTGIFAFILLLCIGFLYGAYKQSQSMPVDR